MCNRCAFWPEFRGLTWSQVDIFAEGVDMGPIGNGALISRNYVLTSASIFSHPLLKDLPASKYKASLGDVNSTVRATICH